jgi:hypothetical protein
LPKSSRPLFLAKSGLFVDLLERVGSRTSGPQNGGVRSGLEVRASLAITIHFFLQKSDVFFVAFLKHLGAEEPWHGFC